MPDNKKEPMTAEDAARVDRAWRRYNRRHEAELFLDWLTREGYVIAHPAREDGGVLKRVVRQGPHGLMSRDELLDGYEKSDPEAAG